MAKKWEIDRTTGIGGSDAAAILGLSPWKSAMDVWMEKKGLREEETDPNREFLLELGTQLEPVIARLYERETGKHLQQPVPVMIRHPDYGFLFGSPDRVIPGEYKGVELKSESQYADGFGEPGTDQVPHHYLVQCAHYMAVMGWPDWDVALLHAGSRFSVYHLHRDMDLERAMLGQLRDWWERYIVGDRPPDVDGSGAWKVYLRKKYPADLLPVMPGDEATNQLVRQLDFTRNVAGQLETQRARLETRLKLRIGEHEGISGEFGKVTWKKTVDTNVVDWKTALATLAKWVDPERVAQVLKDNTTVRPGVRRFLLQLREDWKYGNDRELPGNVAEVRDGNSPSAAEAPVSGTDGSDSAYLLQEKP